MAAIVLGSSLSSGITSIAGQSDGVLVLYAGALNHTNESIIGPAFSRKHGYEYLGEGHGSLVGVRLIKEGLRYPDVFQSADPQVNENELLGPLNDNFIDWYLTFAANEMVIIYHPESKFADDFDLASQGRVKWYDVLAAPGFRFGRTDPDLDPKGYRTVFVMQLAEKFYGDSTIVERVLGNIRGPRQIFRETELLARLESGQIDAVSGYKNEAMERNFPFLVLPEAVNLSSNEFSEYYGGALYESKHSGSFYGSPIVFTISILRAAHNMEGAVAFVSFILSEEGQQLLQRQGFGRSKILVGGIESKVPPALRKYIEGAFDEG